MFATHKHVISASFQPCAEAAPNILIVLKQNSRYSKFSERYKAVCCCLVAKLNLTLLDLMDCSPAGSSIHGISKARILEWVAISFFRGSSKHRDRTCVSCISRQILYN